MSAVAGAAWDAIYTTASLLWMAAWALVLGYAFSSAIQVFVKPTEAAERLGGGGACDVGLATGLGFISSSCSFAALAATRALWTKGAQFESALAFMFASPTWSSSSAYCCGSSSARSSSSPSISAAPSSSPSKAQRR